MFWWQPDIDGGVCAFLGKIDKDFDPYATLRILEAKEEEERLQATAAEINAQIDAKYTRFGRKISEEGLREMWAAMAKGEASSRSWMAEHDGKSAVVDRDEDKTEMTMAAILTDSSNDGDTEGGEGKMLREEKRAEGGMEMEAKAEEDVQMEG